MTNAQQYTLPERTYIVLDVETADDQPDRIVYLTHALVKRNKVVDRGRRLVGPLAGMPTPFIHRGQTVSAEQIEFEAPDVYDLMEEFAGLVDRLPARTPIIGHGLFGPMAEGLDYLGYVCLNRPVLDGRTLLDVGLAEKAARADLRRLPDERLNTFYRRVAAVAAPHVRWDVEASVIRHCLVVGVPVADPFYHVMAVHTLFQARRLRAARKRRLQTAHSRPVFYWAPSPN